MVADEVNINWKSSGENLVHSLMSQAHRSLFSDVVLVCEESERVPAHQVILSSNSSFLKSLLLRHKENMTGESPTIIMPDIKKGDLESLLTFMYRGTTGALTMEENRFEKLVNLTKYLGIKNIKKQPGTRGKSVSIKKPIVKLENLGTAQPRTGQQVLEEEGDNEMDNTDDFNYSDNDEEEPDHVKKYEENETSKKDKESPKKNKLNLDPEKAKMRYKKMFGTFLCPYCAKIFTLKKSLKNHIQNIHEGIRVQCDQCPYQAPDKTRLKRHVETRHEAKSFYCDQCDHVFMSRYSLATHLQTMHSDTEYKCDDCDYKTKQRSNLQKHRDAKHDNVRYPCEICHKSLSQKGQLKVHMIKIHGVDRRRYQTIHSLNKGST